MLLGSYSVGSRPVPVVEPSVERRETKLKGLLQVSIVNGGRLKVHLRGTQKLPEAPATHNAQG